MKVLEEGIKDSIKAAGGKIKAGATKVKDGAKAAPGKARDAYKSLFLKFITNDFSWSPLYLGIKCK